MSIIRCEIIITMTICSVLQKAVNNATMFACKRSCLRFTWSIKIFTFPSITSAVTSENIKKYMNLIVNYRMHKERKKEMSLRKSTVGKKKNTAVYKINF